MVELEAGEFFNAEARRIKEKIRWVRAAETPHAAKWRLTNFLGYAKERMGDKPGFHKIQEAEETVEKHYKRILERWTSTHNTTCMEALNAIFKAARARARGYRNEKLGS